jgi:hypothetical protein
MDVIRNDMEVLLNVPNPNHYNCFMLLVDICICVSSAFLAICANFKKAHSGDKWLSLNPK